MAELIDLTDATFDALVADPAVPALVDFWAPWCGPCLALEMTLREVGHRLDGRLRIGRVDITGQPELAERFAIRTVPTLLLFRAGAVAKRMYGAKSTPVLMAALTADAEA